MIIKKEVLLASMRKCLPGVETGSSIIEGADTFVFSNGAVHSYNNAVSVSAPITTAEPLTGSVKSAEFYKLISKLGADIEITVGAETWEIKSGKTVAVISLVTSNIAEYLSVLKISAIEWTGLHEKFIEAVKLCKIACNTSVHRGIFVQNGIMISTDLQRINVYKLGETFPHTFWIDDPAVVEMMKFGSLVSIAVSADWVHFRSVDGSVFSCRKKEESTFPAGRILEIVAEHDADADCITGTLPPELDSVIDRVGILSRDISGWQAIKLTFHKTEIEAFSQRDAGKITESVPMTVPFPTDLNISIWIDADFILDAAKKVPNFYIKTLAAGAGTRKDFVFKNDYYTQIISTIAE